jgi:SpoVK/Ycf46/Vps4 family AAA+-type ATPase
VLKQGPASAALHLELAYALDKLGKAGEKNEHIRLARGSPDFSEEHPLTQALLGSQSAQAPAPSPTEAPAPVRLELLQGGRAMGSSAMADVISISRTSTVRFSDVVGMADLKKLLRVRIIEPFISPGLFQRFKKGSGGGVLLYGPPGCGKTMIARAIANECSATFTAIGISDILSMWLGAAERNLAAVFDKARQEAPSVLFFDELDALAFSRNKANSDHTRTLVNEFLAQLDGMAGANDKVLILAATNMPWDVDDAMKRPGRFERQVFVPPPDTDARAAMLEAKLRDVPCERIDFKRIAAKAVHYSGADMDGMIEHAKDAAILHAIDTGVERPISEKDLLAALQDLSPSTVDWLKTSRNLIKFGGGGRVYKDVEEYLRREKLY